MVLPNLTPFVASFSENGDQLSQWRAYCPKGNGFSIGFRYSDLSYLLKTTGFRLVKCIYGSGGAGDTYPGINDVHGPNAEKENVHQAIWKSRTHLESRRKNERVTCHH